MQCFAGFGAGENVIYVVVVAKISRNKTLPTALGANLVCCNNREKIKGLIKVRRARFFDARRASKQRQKF